MNLFGIKLLKRAGYEFRGVQKRRDLYVAIATKTRQSDGVEMKAEAGNTDLRKAERRLIQVVTDYRPEKRKR